MLCLRHGIKIFTKMPTYLNLSEGNGPPPGRDEMNPNVESFGTFDVSSIFTKRLTVQKLKLLVNKTVRELSDIIFLFF